MIHRGVRLAKAKAKTKKNLTAENAESAEADIE
jgi:hypothetical protein